MRIAALSALVGLAGFPSAFAQDADATKPTPEQVEFFESRIRPVLVDRCYKCHSLEAGKAKAGLHVDSREALLKGGDSGPAVVPGHPERSLLIKAVRHADNDLRMPVKEKLPDRQIADLAAWIRMGLPDPRRASAAPAPAPAFDFSGARARHWSFRDPKDVRPPDVRSTAAVRTDVDRFLLAPLEAKGLGFAPEAERRTLLRRLSFDLTGLPPTAEEVDAFLADASPDAYEKQVDRLLASPRYGERWGRHWLDVARYADTKEWVVAEERRLAYAYTYRDWVIRAFNADLPYDRFVTLQLAADRAATDRADLAALGFLTVGRSFLNRLPDIIDDRIDVVTRGLLGLTVSCARCHDHKYDPVPTKDYYSLYGVFASSAPPKELPLVGEAVPGPAYDEFRAQLASKEADLAKFREERRASLSADLRTPAKIAAYLLAAAEALDADAQAVATARKLQAAVLRRWVRAVETHAVLAPWKALARKSADPLAGAHPYVAEALAGPLPPLPEAAERLATVLPELLAGSDAPFEVALAEVDGFLRDQDRDKLKKFKRAIEELHNHPGAPPRAMTLEDLPTPVEPRVFVRGNAGTPGEAVPRRFLGILCEDERRPFTEGSGRLELARAIATGGNPLTARVWVNRVWMHHFGAGLVRTPSDFGTRGEPPTHPELLDWLARRFVADGWSTKALHRLLLTSAAWRQSSDNPAAEEADPQNLLLGRQNRQRLELEAFRDAILATAGRLETALGGRPVDLAAAPFTGRRTVYGHIDRLNLSNLHRVFDFAVPDMHAPRRYATTVPQQALFLMNSPFVQEQAARLVARPELAAEADAEQRVQRLYRLVFARAATRREVDLALAFVGSTPPSPSGTSGPLSSWEKYAQVLLQTNEFVFVD